MDENIVGQVLLGKVDLESLLLRSASLTLIGRPVGLFICSDTDLHLLRSALEVLETVDLVRRPHLCKTSKLVRYFKFSK